MKATILFLEKKNPKFDRIEIENGERDRLERKEKRVNIKIYITKKKIITIITTLGNEQGTNAQ